MLIRKREVTNYRTFGDGFIGQLFYLSLPNRARGYIPKYAVDEPGASADRILNITRSLTIEVCSVK